MSQTHVHLKGDELHVWWIPSDTDTPMALRVVENNYQSLQTLVDGYIEIVRTPFLPELSCGCSMVMVVDEEGRLKGREQNIRAQLYYPHTPIVGDAFLIAEGLVKAQWDEGPEPDFFSLPPEFNKWEGPGNPIPLDQPLFG